MSDTGPSDKQMVARIARKLDISASTVRVVLGNSERASKYAASKSKAIKREAAAIRNRRREAGRKAARTRERNARTVELHCTCGKVTKFEFVGRQIDG